VSLSGSIYVARDAAHQRMAALLEQEQPLPFDPVGQIIYYMGPTPAKPGQVIGSAGPTTAGRMDRYTPALLAAGIKATIGKGFRSAAVREAMQQHKAVYFAAIGGAGVLISRAIVSHEVIAWPELGAEALQRLEVRDFICFVVNDTAGNDLYEQGRVAFRHSQDE
jgi:fumarate hydratase subunit beta